MLDRANRLLGPRWRLEVVGRLALVVLFVALLPDIFWADAHAYWRELRDTALDHLPYRDFVWSFPPVTLVVAPAAVALRHSPGGFTVALGRPWPCASTPAWWSCAGPGPRPSPASPGGGAPWWCRCRPWPGSASTT
ncbi:MAG: hypothetical protein H0U26_03965 [Acidimicrobiia bacterium]|nr:hypothetical protein [Acidimicrobiia bacterium]